MTDTMATPPPKPIMVVGTSAPRRRKFAEKNFSADFEFVFLSPDIDEKKIRAKDPYELTRAIAKAKMEAVLGLIQSDEALTAKLKERPGSVAVTFDQVVVWKSEVREKPESEEENKRFLLSYSNDSVTTVQRTALRSLDDPRKRLYGSNTTTTYYSTVPEDVIDRVIARGESRHTAGGFVVEDEEMGEYVTRIDPGTSEEVQGFSARVIRTLLQRLKTM